MTELGLGAVCLGVAPLQDRMDAMADILGLDDSLDAFALIPVGYPAKERAQADRFDPQRISWIGDLD